MIIKLLIINPLIGRFMLIIPGKIPVRIFPFFWIVTIMFGWMNTESIPGTAIWTVVIFTSILVHEFGHALSAIAFGRQATIDLIGFGGVTHHSGRKMKLWQEFFVSLNGPLAGLLLAALVYQIPYLKGGSYASVLNYARTIALYINLFWTIINLLPVHSLDGGNLLRIILEAAFGIRGIKIATFIGFVSAIIVGIYFLVGQSIFAGSLFLMFAFEGYYAWKSALLMTAGDQNSELQDSLNAAVRELNSGYDENAEMLLQKVRLISKKGVIYITATEYMAVLFDRQMRYQEGYELLHSIRKQKLSEKGLGLLREFAYRTGYFKEAISLGNELYQNSPGYESALINAICHAQLGEAQTAVSWLQCAVRDGLPDLRRVLAIREFDAIRDASIFKEFKEKQTFEIIVDAP